MLLNLTEKYFYSYWVNTNGAITVYAIELNAVDIFAVDMMTVEICEIESNARSGAVLAKISGAERSGCLSKI